ncbi:MAG: dimethyl sulfoxide reductase anchor subunit [Anaerolineales bacterium]|jgi:anaerobic dimethyl sulfoxide reductase subunit C (anchor subunit)|nr:dimethyl sulfoxide reductase anchor subunit [Anaerolineales bacterium]
MKERSLVIFTLSSQAAVGIFCATGLLQILHALRAAENPTPGWSIYMLSMLLLGLCFLLMSLSLVVSQSHLGAPARAWRAARNFSTSWLSREIVFGLLFTGFAGLSALSFLFPYQLSATVFTSLIGGLVCGLTFLYSMGRVYMQRTVPGWNTRRTLLTFCLTAASIGLLVTALGLALANRDGEAWIRATALQFGRGAALMLALQVCLHLFYKRRTPPTNPVDPGQRRASPQPGTLPTWGMLSSLLAAVFALLPTLLNSSAWLMYAISLSLALLGEAIARRQFYLSYWRLGI